MLGDCDLAVARDFEGEEHKQPVVLAGDLVVEPSAILMVVGFASDLEVSNARNRKASTASAAAASSAASLSSKAAIATTSVKSASVSHPNAVVIHTK